MLVLALGAAASARLGFIPNSCDPGQGYGGYGSYSADCDAPPTAGFWMWPANPRAGGEVTFSADDEDLRHRYDWDFDDDPDFEVTDTASPTATFPAGTARARLRVTDEFGRSVVSEREFDVHAGNERPTAEMWFTPGAPRVGQEVTFWGYASDADGAITAAAFDFTEEPGCETPVEFDGEFGISKTFVFASGGDKTIRLCVTDDAGATTTTTQTVEVHAENMLPRVSFFPPQGVRTGRPVSLYASGFDPDGTITKYRWDLDGDKVNGYEVDSGTDASRQTVFTTGGSREIGVKVIDADGGEAFDRAVLHVSDVNLPPTGWLAFGSGGTGPDNVVDVNQGVTASIFPSDPDGDFSSPVTLHWDIDGDDVVDFEAAPQPSPRAIPGFPTPGERVIRVKATDSEGASKVFTRVLKVREPNTPPLSGQIWVNSGMTDVIRVGDVVNFSMYAVDLDAEPLTYSWDLDGIAGFEYTTPQFGPPGASRTFDAPGTYTIRARVQDQRGGESVQTVDVTVFAADAANTIPNPAIYASPEQPRTGSTVTLNAAWLTDAEGDQLRYVWDLDGDAQVDYSDADGSLSPTLPNVTLPSAYPVRLKVYEVEQDGTPTPDGLAATTTQVVQFHEGNWKPAFSMSCGGCEFGTQHVGKTISLSAWGNDYDGRIEQQAYDVNGDGDYDDANVDVVQTWPNFSPVVVPLTQAGPLTLRARATDDSGASTEARVLVDVEPAAANQAPRPVVFGVQNPTMQVPINTPLELGVGFSAPPTGPPTYAWDLDDDGAYDDGDQHTVTFPGKPTAGSYIVRAKVNDGELDGIATAVVEVVSGDAPPTIQGVSGPRRVRIDRPVMWTIYTSNGGTSNVRKVEWELDGDGAFDDAVLEHTPMQGPIYTATTPPQTYPGPPRTITIGVRLTDEGGKSTTATREVEITDRNLPPTGWMSFSPTPPVAGQAITFEAEGNDPDGLEPTWANVAFAWDLDGDGEYDDATGAAAQRTFAQTGSHTVGVKLTDADGGTEVIRETLRVGTERPVAAFTWAPQAPKAGDAVTFTSSSSDPDGTEVSFQWDFDEDGLRDFDDSTASNPTHTFQQPGTYRVALRVSDADGDRSTRYETVEVGGECDPCAWIDQVTAFPVKNRPVVLSAITSDPDNGDEPVPGSGIAWDLPNGDAPAFDDATGEQVTIPSLSAGYHLVRVQVTDAEGRSAIDFIHVYVADDQFRPEAYLEATPDSPSTGRPVTWTAFGYDPDDGEIVAYEFDRNGDGDFDDAGEDWQDSDELVLTACSQACTIRVGVRVKDSADQVSDPVWQTVEVHEGNIPPTVELWANRDVAGVNALVRFHAYAYDEDDWSSSDNGILTYEWDFDYDPQAPDFAVGEATEEKSFATPGTYTVAVKVTDRNATAPETAIATSTVQVTSGNAEPQPRIYVWPNPIKANQPFSVMGDGNDPDGDAIVKWEWDADGTDGYEVTNGQQTLEDLVLTSTGATTLKLRVTDARGKTGETSLQVNVVNAPPRAVIDGPSSVDRGDSETEFDEAAVIAQGRTIVERKWDLDNDGEWDSTAEKVKLDTATVGYRSIRLWVKDSAGETDETSRTIAVREPKDVSPPEPVVDPSTHVSVGTTVNPYTGLSTITIPRGQVAALPNQCLPLDVNFKIKKSATAVVENAKLLITKTDNSVLEIPMTDADGDGVHTVHIDCAVSGTMRVQYSFAGDATVFTTDIGGIQLLDPQGVVYDRAKYDEELSKIGKTHATATEAERAAARSATAIAGATVTLQRLVDGQWTTVSENDPGIEPNVNPQVTGANGLYQWDVSAGTYRVVVVRDGYADVTSTQVVIPPPVLDLHIPLERNYAPVADFTLSRTDVARTESVTLTSTATDIGGSIESYEWDVDGDGYDDGDTATLQKALTGALGQRTIKLRVTDNEGAKDVASKTVTVTNKAPAAGTISVAPVQPVAGEEVTLTLAGAADTDTANAVTIDWDIDGDGFDDGTGTTLKVTPPSHGAYTVRARVTDSDGGTAVGEKTAAVLARPVAAFTSSPASVVRGEEVTFASTSTDADGTIVKYEWDADGSDFAEGQQTLKRSFTSLGSKTIKLRVTDNDGLTRETTRTVDVTNTAPSAGTIGVAPAKPVAGEEVTLTLSGAADTDTNDAVTIAWDVDGDGFDDGTDTTAKFTPSSHGTKTVKAKVTDGDGDSAEATEQVLVKAGPVAALTATPASVARGEEVTFASTSLDADGTIAKYEWDVDGGGFTEGEQTLRHSFATLGSKTVRLRVTDSDGFISEATEQIAVVNKAPSAGSIVVAPAEPVAGEELTLTLEGAGDPDSTEPLEYEWDIDDGDGFVADAATKRFTPLADGVRTVKVRVTDGDEASAVASREITVLAGPRASFTASKESVQRGEKLTFTAAASDADGAVESYEWDLGDGAGYKSGPAELTTTLTGVAGERTVRLRVTDNHGLKTEATGKITLLNKAPTAGTIAVLPEAPRAGDKVNLTASGASDPDGNQLTFAWDIDDDGSYDDGAGPSIETTLAEARTYKITVQATDADGETGTATKDVVVAAKPEEPKPSEPKPQEPKPSEPPPDTTPPALTLAAAGKQTIKTLLAKGLALSGSCSEACSVKVDVLVDSKTAKTLGIDTKAKASVVIGKAAASLAAGAKTTIKVKLTAKAKKALKKAKKLKLAVKATATDAALNAATKSLSVSLKAK